MEILDGEYKVSESVNSRAVIPESEEQSYSYEGLKVYEDTSRSGGISFKFELEDFGEFELEYFIGNKIPKQFFLLEALTEGYSLDQIETLYSENSQRDAHFEEQGLYEILENEKLPEETREPVNKFLHDILWKQ